MFEETLEFEQAILLFYGRQNALTLQRRVLKAQVSAIVKVVTNYLNPMVRPCVMN